MLFLCREVDHQEILRFIPILLSLKFCTMCRIRIIGIYGKKRTKNITVRYKKRINISFENEIENIKIVNNVFFSFGNF